MKPVIQATLAIEPEDDVHRATDAFLTSAAKSGHSAAFDELSRRHSKRIQRHIYRILGNWEDTEDVLQDSLLKAFKHLDQFRGTCSFSTWLTSIAINSALMVVRKRRVRLEISFDGTAGSTESSEPWEFPDLSPGPELLYADREVQALLRGAIMRLPWCIRSVAELYHAKECSTNEVAQALGLSVAAVKSRLLRARKTLRASLPELQRADSRRVTRILLWILLLSGLFGKPRSASSQIGSGAPDASSRVQVQVQGAPGRENQTTAQTKTFAGQALDQDSAVLATVPANPLFKRDPFHPILGPVDGVMDELRKAERLSFAATYTVVNQYATETPDGVRHNWATGRFDLSGGWKAYDHGGNAGTFSILVRSGVNLGMSQKFNLSDSLGSGLVLNCLPGGGPQEPITLNVLYYRQDFYRKKFAFYIGKIHPNEFVTLSLYNNDERSQFLNAENDGNLTIPSDGTYAGGAALEYQATQHFYIHAVTVDTEGAQQRNLKTLVDKKYLNGSRLDGKRVSPPGKSTFFGLGCGETIRQPWEVEPEWGSDPIMSSRADGFSSGVLELEQIVVPRSKESSMQAWQTLDRLGDAATCLARRSTSRIQAMQLSTTKPYSRPSIG